MRALVVVGGTLGAAAIWHRRHRRLQAELSAGPDPAQALRAKLAASKAAAVAEPPRAEGPVKAPPESLSEVPALDPETRRRAVHEETRASIDELGSADA
jgi:hypothetical protein